MSAAAPASWWKVTFIYSFLKLNGTAWPLKSVQKTKKVTGTLISAIQYPVDNQSVQISDLV